jgi:glutamyl-tRNA synthetase
MSDSSAPTPPAPPASLGPSQRPPRGRWAPSPSGLLHVGSARTALAAWLSVRSRGGTLVWRLEDLDPPRVVPGAAEAAMADLAWLGLDWDEGLRLDAAGGLAESGRFAPYAQSRRAAVYEAALERLHATGRLFPCRRSRKDLAAVATAPHGAGGSPPYPASLRPRRLAPGWFEALRRAERPGAALRFRVDPGEVAFTDRVHGERRERVDETVGDFVLKRRDGLYAYQLAVVVDDLAMEIDEVVRGVDLLDSTARQLQLFAALGAAAPAWAHVPVVRNAAGEKLNKRDAGLTLASLREAGVAPERLVGHLAWSLGLLDRPGPCRPGDLVAGFAWSQVRREDWVLPEGFAGRLAAER